MEHVEEEMVWTDLDSDEENMLDVNDLSILNKVNRVTIIYELIFTIFNKLNFRLKVKNLLNQMKI